MRHRGDYRQNRDFDESEHPRDARGRFVDDDENEDYGRGSGRRGYGGGGYESGRYGGGYRREAGGHFGEGGLTRGGGWSDRNYRGSEGGFGYPEEGMRSAARRGGQSGTGEYEDYRGAGGEGSGYRYGQGGRVGRGEDDEGQSDYHHWRGEQMKKFDADYDEWRQERRKKFSEDFDKWRGQRSGADKSEGANKK